MRLLRSVFLLSLVLVAAACGRKDDLQHRVRNYDVVEEGSASGVTTSLGGEQPGSVPLTATDVDTTTDLTLLPGTGDTAITDMAAPGSLAETLEIDPAAPPRSAPPGEYRPSSPAPARRDPSPQPSSEPAPSRPARETPPTETAAPAPAPPAEEPEAPPTSTTPTTTATQPEEPPPPPPTTTSTQPM
ncbi:MAG TPA: hypothetical protein VFV54_10135 [Thermoanaerobaculia bacterium]|nr:hypothetical protein [Thermoanaerobaculia bacterium]